MSHLCLFHAPEHVPTHMSLLCPFADAPYATRVPPWATATPPLCPLAHPAVPPRTLLHTPSCPLACPPCPFACPLHPLTCPHLVPVHVPSCHPAHPLPGAAPCPRSAACPQTQEVQELARGARSRAEEALGRSQAARSRAEKATAQLRDFIRRIKAFLAGSAGTGWAPGMTGVSAPTPSPPRSCVPAEEGADPGSIELVAHQVLNISLPSSPGRIQELLREMQESIGQLEGVDAVLSSTAQGLAAARGLLEQGRDARRVAGDVPGWAGRGGLSRSAGRVWSCPCRRRARAEGVRDELAGTQRELEAARVQATAAGSTLQSSRDAIRAAESRAKEVRGTRAAGTPGLRSRASATGTAGEQGRCLGHAGGNRAGAVGHWE